MEKIKKILIVEDDPVTRRILTTLLSDIYEVAEAADGQDALSKTDGVNLIICDFHMPNMTGQQFAEKISHKNIPFLMLTVDKNTMSADLAKKIGITGWLTKPFAPNALMLLVNEIFSKEY